MGDSRKYPYLYQGRLFGISEGKGGGGGGGGGGGVKSGLKATTSRRFKCVPQILGSLSIHIFTLLFLLITYSYRCSADNTACFRRAQAL